MFLLDNEAMAVQPSAESADLAVGTHHGDPRRRALQQTRRRGIAVLRVSVWRGELWCVDVD